MTAEEVSSTTTESDDLSTGTLIAIVACSVVMCGLMSTLCFICYRRKHTPTATEVDSVDVDNDEIVGNIAIMEEKEDVYDMNTIGRIDGRKDVDGIDESDIMVEVTITETE